MSLVSLVVPVFNEEAAVPIFLSRVVPILRGIDVDYEIIFVDDGSGDGTVAAVTSARATDPSLKLLSLSRNFGKEAALTAGMDWSTGDAVIPIDVDLQDPPELIVDFIRLWLEGFDVVVGQRIERDADTRAKRMTSRLFYRLFNRIASRPIEADVGDYRLMSRRAVNATLELRERNRFMKGLFSWVGFRTASVPYERPARAAGTTKFNYWKLWNFALDGITSFSTIPLKVWTYVGGTVAVAAILYMVIIAFRTLLFGRDVPGYASLMVVMLMLGAVQLISLGIIGEYLGRLYVETKQRPIYLLQRAEGFAAPNLESAPTSDAGSTVVAVSSVQAARNR